MINHHHICIYLYNCYFYFMINRHHFQGFDFAEEQNMAFKMSSFAETMALGYLKSQVHKYANTKRSQGKSLGYLKSRVMGLVCFKWKLHSQFLKVKEYCLIQFCFRPLNSWSTTNASWAEFTQRWQQWWRRKPKQWRWRRSWPLWQYHI